MSSLLAINWLAVLAATVAAFMLGGLWFSPVMFAERWVAAIGRQPEEMGSPLNGMILSFLTTFVMSIALALIIGRLPLMTALGGLRFGLVLGAGVILMGMISDAAFTRSSRALLWIQGSYHVLMVTIMSVILAAWR